MLRLSISVNALADIDAIWRYFARQNPRAADGFIDRFYARFDLIQSGPDAGETRPDLGDGIRQTIVEPYLILYECDAKCVNIVRVIHGARDVPTAFHNA